VAEAGPTATAIDREETWLTLARTLSKVVILYGQPGADLRRILQALCELSVRLTGAAAAAILPYDERARRFLLDQVAAYPPDVLGTPGELSPRPAETARQVMGRGELYVDDTADRARFDFLPDGEPDFPARLQAAAFAGLCLQVGEVTVGVLYVAFPARRKFTDPREQAALRLIAHQAAFMIQDTLLLQTLQAQRMEQVEALSAVERAILGAGALELDDVLQQILGQAARLANAEIGEVRLVDAEGKYLEVRASLPPLGSSPETIDTSFARIPVSRTRGITSQVYLSGESALLGDVTQVPQYVPFFTGMRSELCVPLKLQDKVIGVLNVESRQPAAFTTHDQTLLEAFAHQAGVAIATVRSYKRFQALQEVIEETHAQPALERVLQTILSKAAGLVDASIGELRLADPDRKVLEARATLPPLSESSAQVDGAYRRIPIYGPRAGVTSKVFRTGRPIRLDHVDKATSYLPYHVGMQSELCVPLMERGRPIGVLNVESPRPAAFSQIDQMVLEAFAQQAVVAIRNAQVLERLEALRQVGLVASSSLEPDDVIDQVLEQTFKLFPGAPVGTVQLLDREKKRLTIVAQRGRSVEEEYHVMSMEEGITGWVARTGQPALVDDVTQDERFVKFVPGVRSELAVPIKFGDEVKGVLNIEHHEVGAFDREDLHLLEGIAAAAGVAIHNAQTYRQLQEQERRTELEARWAMLGRMVAGLAHRMNNMAGMIRTAAGEVKRKATDLAPIERDLERISRNAEYLLRLARQLRTPFEQYARAEKGQFDINELLKRSLELAATPDEVQVQMSLTPGLPRAIPTEAVTDVLIELIRNAVKAMRHSETKLLRLSTGLRNGRWVEVAVQDSGCGIPPQIQERIFEFYFSPPAGEGKDWGIGLWWVDTFIRTLRGEIEFTTEPGKGTTFYVRFPMR
jgi:GAF domain-containing protein